MATKLDFERAMDAASDGTKMMQELAYLFHYLEPGEKRVEGVIIPTDESLEILEDYLSRWSWIIVQRLSEPGTVTSEFAPEDANLSLQDAVIEIILYGLAYLAARRNRPADEVIPGKEEDADCNVKDNQYPLKGEPVKIDLPDISRVEDAKTKEQGEDIDAC